MIDLITLALAKKAGGGGSGGGVTPQQLEEALATKQNALTAGAGIGITDDEIRVTYGENHYGEPVYDAAMEQAQYTGVGTLYCGMAGNHVSNTDFTPLVTENDIIKIVTDETATDCAFIDPSAGDEYQQKIVWFATQLHVTVEQIYCRNCHGLYISDDFATAYLVKDAAGTEQTDSAYVFALAKSDNDIPLFLVLANTDYPMAPSEDEDGGTYTISILTDRSLIPDSAYEFGAVAVGDERPVNGDTVKAAINGAGSGITLTMDAAKNLTVALRDALGRNIQTGTVNLPLESMVIGGRYADGVLYLTIIDQEEELEIPIADIVSGLVPDTRTVAGMPLSSDITATALANIIGGELGHINADWSETDSSSAAYIRNKPALFSGSYNDLTNKPSLAVVATSGSYNDLSNKPTIPTIPQNIVTGANGGSPLQIVVSNTAPASGTAGNILTLVTG